MHLTRTLESWFNEASRQFPVLLVARARQVGKTTPFCATQADRVETDMLILPK